VEKLKPWLPTMGNRLPVIREAGILLIFCALTALLTWPYVTRMRDAVVDPGDPYLISWILWWDYHQTFAHPLQLFHANTFFPYRYTLAFSEHSYGIALLFFPLFALGFRPLTVHAVAIFFGFATSGYGAFRLARTLTGSYATAWVAGIVFGFGPFRFHYMSHLLYLFSMWMPLVFEALVLFVRNRSKKRMVWLGVAFFMLGLSTISWFILSLFPLALCTAILLTRYQLWRDRDFWLRGSIALGLASVALVPFMLPYYIVSKLYGFKRSIEEVKSGSASPIHWLSVESRNKFWRGLGDDIPDGYRFKLFPGLLPILLSLAAMPRTGALQRTDDFTKSEDSRNPWIKRLDVLILIAFGLSLLAIGFQNTKSWYGIFHYLTSARMLSLLTISVIARLCQAYPKSVRLGAEHNLIATIRSEQRSDAFWVGIMLFVVGFCYSLGWNFFVYRILYDVFLPFHSMRVPARGSMVAYLGLSLLAGLGCKRIADSLSQGRLRVPRSICYVIVCSLLLVEFNGAPLKFIRGEVFPDAVTVRLKETPMRGGIVVLPAGADFNHRRMLRAADHGKPLITGTSGFNPPFEDQIEALTRSGPISDQLVDLLEVIPASYVVIENDEIAADRRTDYNNLLARAMGSSRLRFINRFDGHDDLYAVIKTEPEARSEGVPPLTPQPVDAVTEKKPAQ
jgi:hypothetical protein